MTETELKFQVPPERIAGVQQAVAAVGAGQVRLRARYFDTPGRHLAQAAMALRLRLEGDRWVQTLKGRGDGMFRRLEHEVVLDGTGDIVAATVPALDLSRHDGTPAGEALRRALGDQADALACRYETDVARSLGLVRAGPDAATRVELALDCGEIRAGTAVWPLQELEFELKDGPAAGLLALAAEWVDRHGLWLDVRSKAERGERLASGRVIGPAHPAVESVAEPVVEPADGDDGHALARLLPPLLANLADLIDPRSAGCDVQAHAQQARIGIERLRGSLAHGSTLAARLAELRDALDADPAVDARLRAPAVQRLWLDLIGALAGR